MIVIMSRGVQNNWAGALTPGRSLGGLCVCNGTSLRAPFFTVLTNSSARSRHGLGAKADQPWQAVGRAWCAAVPARTQHLNPPPTAQLAS